MVIYNPTSPNWCLCTTWGNTNPEIVSFQYGKDMSSPGECGWLWKEPISYSKCSKWRPLAFPHAWNGISPLVNGVANDALRDAHPCVNAWRCFKLSVSRTGVLYTCCCIQTQIQYSTGFRPGLLGGHRSGEMNCGFSCCNSWTVLRANNQWRQKCINSAFVVSQQINNSKRIWEIK